MLFVCVIACLEGPRLFPFFFFFDVGVGPRLPRARPRRALSGSRGRTAAPGAPPTRCACTLGLGAQNQVSADLPDGSSQQCIKESHGHVFFGLVTPLVERGLQSAVSVRTDAARPSFYFYKPLASWHSFHAASSALSAAPVRRRRRRPRRRARATCSRTATPALTMATTTRSPRPRPTWRTRRTRRGSTLPPPAWCAVRWNS